jgi:hypothetical protein
MLTTRLASVCCLAFLAPLLVPAEAQVIRVKTLPIAEGEQFTFMPSGGMAGVSIALADSLLDPFTNPAKGGRSRGTQYFGAPSFYSVSANSGAGTTFPLGATVQRGSLFGAFAAAYQQLHRPAPANDFAVFRSFVPADDVTCCPTQRQARSDRNNYTYAMLGHRFDSARVSIAASALWSGLAAVEGVDQFYEQSDWLRQKGEALDMRLGVLKEWAGGQSLEAVVVRNRFGHSHDVGFTDLFWDPAQRRPIGQPRTEQNAERTHNWGVHVEYERPIADSGWRVGALMTANRISHLRIPGYEAFNGLGTAGRSNAFNLGVGLGRSHGLVDFGVDAIYEPIRSQTWIADSVDNRFRYSNIRLRGGIGRTFTMTDPGTSLRVQLGAELYSVHYVMNQQDRVNNAASVRRETWLERSRTAGMSFRIPGAEVHYQVRTRTGVARPGVDARVQQGGGGFGLAPADVSIGPWMPPVVDAGALGAVRVTWHQFAISIPRP